MQTVYLVEKNSICFAHIPEVACLDIKRLINFVNEKLKKDADAFNSRKKTHIEGCPDKIEWKQTDSDRIEWSLFRDGKKGTETVSIRVMELIS